MRLRRVQWNIGRETASICPEIERLYRGLMCANPSTEGAVHSRPLDGIGSQIVSGATNWPRLETGPPRDVTW